MKRALHYLLLPGCWLLSTTATAEDVRLLSALDVSSEPDNIIEELFSKKRGVWSIDPLRPNYLLPITYSKNPNQQPLRDEGELEQEYDHLEVKFQISFGLSLAEDLLWDNGDINLGYTQVSYWNAYNNELSEPFRESNFEPELFALFDADFDLWGLRHRAVSIGFVHQSNGERRETLSRSWNRIYLNSALEYGKFALSVKPWLRLGNDSTFDEYLGYGELSAFVANGDHVFSIMGRNNFRASNNRGALEFGWSFPLYHQLRGYLQFFSGYGESLIDFDHRNQRIGLGVLLSDWL